MTSNNGGFINTLVEGAVIKNISLKEINISCQMYTAYDGSGTDMGGLVATSYGTISNCFVSGKISIILKGVDTSPTVGGIIGQSYGTIESSYNSCNINIDSSRLSLYWGTTVAGGIAGIAEKIVNCGNNGYIAVYSTTKRTSKDYYRYIHVGGIAGTSEILQASYSIGGVKIQSFVPTEGAIGAGELLGYIDKNTYVYGCYYYGETAFGQNVDSTATAEYIELSDMNGKEAFKEFDFNSKWYMIEGITKYPILQIMKSDIALPKPFANMKSGTYKDSISINLFSDVKGASIYYTLDGSQPNKSSLAYTGSLKISINTTLKAILTYDNLKNSEMVTYVYKIKIEKPTANIKNGARVNKGTKIKLSCKNSKATIYYTLDGTTPTTRSKKYTNPIIIDKNTKIKAMSVKVGMTESDILAMSYYIKKEIKG